jgi:hypothetical protein
LQRFPPKKRRRYPPRRGLSLPHKTLLLGSSPEIGPSGTPRKHGDDLRTALSNAASLTPEAHASRSRPIRSRIRVNSCRGTATSASWKTMYLECVTTFSPILTSFSRARWSGSSSGSTASAPTAAASSLGCTPARSIGPQTLSPRRLTRQAVRNPSTKHDKDLRHLGALLPCPRLSNVFPGGSMRWPM